MIVKRQIRSIGKKGFNAVLEIKRRIRMAKDARAVYITSGREGSGSKSRSD